jgi:hypothetical protein
MLVVEAWALPTYCKFTQILSHFDYGAKQDGMNDVQIKFLYYITQNKLSYHLTLNKITMDNVNKRGNTSQ